MMNFIVTFIGTSVAVCEQHSHLANELGWSFLEQAPDGDDWPCYFEDVGTFWHEVNGQRYSSRAIGEKLQAEATTAAAYCEIVKRAYGNLRGVTFGIEKGGQGCG